MARARNESRQNRKPALGSNGGTRSAARWRAAVLVHVLAAVSLGACLGDTSDLAPGVLTGLPPDAFDNVVVPTAGHPGWTSGSFGVSGDGAATYHVPLWTPAGRAGIEPHLSLEYSSRAGDSIVGMGWSIAGLSAITRCARTRSVDGELGPAPVSFEESIFCLDGVRLVPADPAAIGNLPGRLRPIRNSSSSIEVLGTNAVTPDGFVVHDGSGRRLTYEPRVTGRRWYRDVGYDQATDIVALPSQWWDDSTYGWLLTRVEDLAGNYLTVEYETIVHGPEDYGATEVRPTVIRYTGHGTTVGQRAVHFVYDAPPVPHNVRFVSGLALVSTDHLSNIYMYGPDSLTPARSYALEYEQSAATQRLLLTTVRECDGTGDGTGVCREPIVLHYSEGGFTTSAPIDTGLETFPYASWASVNAAGTMSTIDLDGDGAEELLASGRTLGVSDGYWHSLHFNGAALTMERIDIPDYDNVTPFDYDGDGLAEVLRQPAYVFEDPASVVRLTPGSGGGPTVWAPSPIGVSLPQCGAGSQGTLGMADVTGDGFPPFLVQCLSSSVVWYSQAWRGSLASVHWTDRSCAEGGDCSLRPFQATSLDASGRATVVYRRTPTAATQIPTLIHVPLESGPSVPATSLTLNLDPDGRWVFLDVNGDGLSDALDLRDGVAGFSLRINMGGFFAPAVAALDTPPTNPGYAFASLPDVRVADFNGDGRSDFALLVHTWDQGRVGTPPNNDAMVVHLSNGHGFTTAGAGSLGLPGEATYVADPSGPLPGTGVPGGVWSAEAYRRESWPFTQFFDANGDGDTYMTFQPSSYQAEGLNPNHLYVRRLYAGTPDLLSGVDRGTRTQAAVAYSRERYLSGDCSAPDGPVTCGSRPITVSTHTDELGREHHHVYAGPRFDVEGHGWLGFSRHLEWESLPGTTDPRITDTYFDVPEVIDAGGQAQPTGDPQYGTRYATAGRVRVEIGWEPMSEGVERVTARFFDYVVPVAAGQYPIAQVSNIHTREWNHLSSTWALPALDASPPLGIESFPLPTEPPSRHVDQDFKYQDYGFAIPEQITETVLNGGTTVVNVAAHPDFDNWLLSVVDSITITSTTAAGLTQTRTSSFEWGFPNGGGGIDFPHLLRRTVREPTDTGDLYRSTTYKRDARGLVERTTVANFAGEVREAQIYYDSEGIFPRHLVNLVNEVGHERWIGVDPSLGVVVYESDEREVETRRQFDRFGRLRDQEGHGQHVAVSYLDPLGDRTRMEVVSQPAGGAETHGTVDCFGRNLGTRSQGFDGWVESTPTYDALGRLAYVEEPHYATSVAQAFATFTYDGADRITQVAFSDDSTIQMSYVGPNQTVTDRRGHITTTTLDAGGRTVAVQEAPADGNSPATYLAYVYGPFGQVREMYDHRGFTWSWEHDAYGRTLSVHDPDSGDRFYQYDGFDQLEAELESAGGIERAHYYYDDLGRPTHTESTVDGTVEYEWDTTQLGLLTRTTRLDDGISRVYGYDALGRLETETTYVDAEEYQLDWAYDSFGRPASVTYPEVAGSRRTITYGYDAEGFATSLTDGVDVLWTGDHYDAHGRLTHETLGSGSTMDYAWGAENSWLESVELRTQPGGLVMDLTYGHDEEGNVTSRTDTALTVGGSEIYTYDNLDRLRTRTLGTDPAESYDYDDLGNLSTYAGRIQAYSPVFPHRLTNSGGTVVQHDPRGRMTAGPGWTATYTDFDLPDTVTPTVGPTVSFRYDAGGQRVVRNDGTRRTVTIDGLYEHRDGATPTDTWNVQAGGRTIAQYTRSGTTTNLFYLHDDGLGSPTVVTDSAGNIRERYAHGAFGEQTQVGPDGTFAALPTPAERATFTGHEADRDLGLINMQGRMYDPTIGRFLTPDPIVHSATSRQAWNPYSYAGNNPETNTDPSGFDWVDDGGWGYWDSSTDGAEGAGLSGFWRGFGDLFHPDSSDPEPLFGQAALLGGAPSYTGAAAPPPPPAAMTYDATLSRFMAAHAPVTPGRIGVDFNGGFCPSCHEGTGCPGVPPGELPPAITGTLLFVIAAPVAIEVGEGALLEIAASEAAQLRVIHALAYATEFADGVVAGEGGAMATGAVMAASGLGLAGVASHGGGLVGALPSHGGGVVAGEAGRFARLEARAVVADALTPHHMPQAALGFTSRADGGALVLPAAEHALTRTYGALGRATRRAEADMVFRDVLARDMRDVRQIAGSRYDQGLRDLLQYYRDNYPELMRR